MSIDKIPASPQSPLPNRAKNESAAGATQAVTANSTPKTRGSGVALTVSNAARALEKTGTGDVAEVDSQKVASVRSAIQDGSYVVNPEAIADKLLSNAQEMLNRTTN
jgi:negative regulator of flagellin synthesis FlgM